MNDFVDSMKILVYGKQHKFYQFHLFGQRSLKTFFHVEGFLHKLYHCQGESLHDFL